MGWLYLIFAGVAEVGWAYGLKMSHGFSHIGWTIVTFVVIGISFFFFARAMKTISMGTAYAVFTGIGAAGTAIVSIIYLDEAAGFLKIASLFILIMGILGLKLLDKKPKTKVE